MPKKVAIIGAGPSGLVTAKTLLQQNFSPVVFESRRVVGGLWAVTTPTFIDKDMRTNLSRYTVAFSDFSWERNVSAAAEDLFPRAEQVNEYVDKYAQRYIPGSVLRLGCRVLQTLRSADGVWSVTWADRGTTHTEDFDHLVVASGYFHRPSLPNIPGLSSFPQEQCIHSSLLTSSSQEQLLASAGPGSTILVVGGSMSGAEAASSLALASLSPLHASKNIQIQHLASRPFWAVPTYLPDSSSSSSGEFLPLDLVMYDLARRPPGDITYAFAGPEMPPTRAALVHSYFRGILGSDQADVARFALQDEKEEEEENDAPWVAVTDHYAGFVRAGTIMPRRGRVESIVEGRNVQIRESSSSSSSSCSGGSICEIQNVAGIVLATGFTPCEAIASILPAGVLAALEYSPDDTVFPLALDDKATYNPAVPDLGFVGMYRGPYWGVMEMQARSLAQRWACSSQPDLPVNTPSLRGSSLPSFRNKAQFPMGDYVGIIETFARELGIQRLPVSVSSAKVEGDDERTGPAVPVRYSSIPANANTTTITAEINATRTAVADLLRPQLTSLGRQRALSHAVFCALHGSWRVTFCYKSSSPSGSSPSSGEEKSFSGSAVFRPRRATAAAAAAGGGSIEYEYHEEITGCGSAEDTVVSIYDKIQISGARARSIEFVDVQQDEDYQFRHLARGVFLSSNNNNNNNSGSRSSSNSQERGPCEYVVFIKGVQVVWWQEIMELAGERQVKTYTR